MKRLIIIVLLAFILTGCNGLRTEEDLIRAQEAVDAADAESLRSHKVWTTHFALIRTFVTFVNTYEDVVWVDSLGDVDAYGSACLVLLEEGKLTLLAHEDFCTCTISITYTNAGRQNITVTYAEFTFVDTANEVYAEFELEGSALLGYSAKELSQNLALFKMEELKKLIIELGYDEIQ